jgi:hypothetical protein
LPLEGHRLFLRIQPSPYTGHAVHLNRFNT